MAAVRLAFLALLAASTSVTAQDAPFCVVSGYGTRCDQRDRNLCEVNARAANGMCVANPNALTPSRQPNVLDLAAHVQRGGEAGAERGRQMAAQRTLAAQATAPAQQPLIVYRCALSDGSVHYTATPAVGCVVVSLDQPQTP